MVVHIDPTQLNQIVMNLCTNAYHAMEEKGGKLDIELDTILLSEDDLVKEADVQPGMFYRLSVSDTGTGMPEEILKRIFDPYFTTKETGKGTGLGLAIVHGIVKAAGGFIGCYSKPGQGTVFHVYLPTKASDSLTELKVVEEVKGGSETIFYVDDEKAIAEVTESILKKLGYAVTVTTDSKHALSLVVENPGRFDLVISDQTMPGLTGSMLAEAILSIRQDLPIILCTGYSSILDKEKAIAIGVRELLLKPLSRLELAKAVRTVLDCPKQ